MECLAIVGFGANCGLGTKDEHAMARRRTFLEDRPLGIEPPREVEGGVEVSLPAVSEGWHPVVDWVGVELMENMVYLVTRVEWRVDEHGEWNPDPQGHVRADGRLYVSEDGWREFGVLLASGEDPLSMFEGAWQLVWEAGFEFADPGFDDVTTDLRVARAGSFELPSENIRMRLPPFLLERLGGLELVRRAVADLASLTYENTMVHREYYRAFLEMGPFSGEQKYEVLRILHAVFTTRPRAPVVGSEVLWGVVQQEISRGMTYVDDLRRLLGKEMASQEQDDNQQSRRSQGTNRDEEQNQGSDQESAKPEGTKEEGKGLSTGESSGKVGGSKRGPQENREGRDDERVSPPNSGGTAPKKTKVSDARRKLAEIERRTAEYKARLIEQMMAGNEEDPQGEGSREGRKTSQGEARSLKGEILGPQGERVNWNSPGGMRRAVILLNNLEIDVVEAEPVAEIVWDQPRGRGAQANFILEGNGQDRVNITTRRVGAEKKLIQDTVMEKLAGTSADQQETEAGEQEKVYGKVREEEPVDKATVTKKKFKYQIPILISPEIDGTLSKLLGTMVSVSFQTMLQASPRLLKGLRQLLTRKREEAPEPQEQGTEEAKAPQGVSNLQRILGDLEDLEKASADIRLSLPDREGGEVMRAPPGTKLSFHALPVGKLKVQIGTHHTDALVDDGAEITLIRRDFATVTGCTVNKEVAGSIRGAGGEIPFTGYVTKCAVKAGIRESIWSFQRMTVMEEMDHDIILGRHRCANVEMIGIHLHDGTYMVDIEYPVTGRRELLRLLGIGGDPPKGKLATWSPTFEESARKGAFARMEASGPKSILAVPEVTILGFRCGAYGRRPDPAKTDKISQWPTPLRTTTEVRAFLGVVGFWRIFIKGFAKIAEAIRAMIREGGTMEWTEDREAAAQTLKDILSSNQVTLAAPNFNDEFDYKVERIAGLRNRADGLSRVCITPEGIEDAEPIDAFLEYEGGTLAVDNEMADSIATTGQLLIQTLEKGAPPVVAELREGPVTTFRRKDERDSWGAVIGPKEELMAMVVEGGRNAVMTLAESWTQKELQYLVNQAQEEQGTDQREREFFLIQMYEGIFREVGLLLIGNKQPLEVSPKAREEAEKYVLMNGHLFKKEEGMMPIRVVCGRSGQLDIIQAMHDGLAGGHRSSKGTLAKITPLYFWPGMAGMVATYCQACLICQERSSARVFEPLRPTRVLGPEHLIHLDLEVMPVSTDGYRYILDARDNLSGYIEAVALKRKTGKGVADWIEDFNLRDTFMRRFIADNGTEFVNQEVLSRLNTLCVPIKIIEPYHPEANAPVEKGHRTLKNTITKLAVDDLGNWSRYLKQAVFSENMTPKRMTGCIPAELWYGREIDFPIEALVPTWNRLDDDPHLTTEELIVARCQQVARTEEALEEVVNRVMDSRMRDKARWDQVKNIRKEPLQVGEKVLVRNSALESTWSGQLGKRFKGPYRIAKRVELNTFELEDLDGASIRRSFPGQRLARFLSRDPVEQWLQEAQDGETGELTA
ncbi:hypothetical protein CBR_g23432 [Chara braunii]|uniref:Integrase catalytic domain-containing protein n=1 Tax=Chara braunii TaxID=69332 RepID=A0A388L482_CHABU|nr:hypothetical protein CBR_g23432 [Chara braunii]|eukprot:GBG77107.1 hypothetical protein CBR_g23432 [Chara braunii]